MSAPKSAFLNILLIFILSSCASAITPQPVTMMPSAAQSVISEAIHPTAPETGTPTVFSSTSTATPPASRINSSKEPDPLPSLSRAGIAITIQKVSSESDQLLIDYKIIGLPPNIFGPERAQTLQQKPDKQEEDPIPEQVLLPDGTSLKKVSIGGCQGASDLTQSWLSCQITFSPLPKGANQFTLIIHRLQNALPGELPEDWQIPFRLTPVTPSQATPVVQALDLRSQPVGGVTLRMLKVSQAPDQTAFQLGLEWEGSNRMLHHTAPITLQDSQDHYYILTNGPDGGSASIDHPNFSNLASLVTFPVKTNSPLIFRLNWIVMSATAQTNLLFDPGKDAKVGQEWNLNEKINAGGFDLHFIKARLKKTQDGLLMLEFDVEAPPEVVAVNLSTKDGSPQSETGMDLGRKVMVSRISLTALPIQPIELTVYEVLYRVNGPWKINWMPQQVNFPEAPTQTPAPTRLAGPAPTLVPNAPLLVDLQALLTNAYADDLVGSGWIHQVIEQDLAENVGILDSGDTPQQPQLSRVETWYHLNGQGYVQTTINIRKTMDGKTLSVDLDNGIYHFSLPEGRGGISQDVYLAKPSFDSDLISMMNGDLANGGSIRQESVVIAGHPCRLYEVTRPYNPSQILEGEPAPVQATRYSVCVDPVNGKVIQIQTQMVYADGSSRAKETNRWISIEKVDTLPDDINQLLEKIIMP
jgi:hypothetical protein